MKHLTCLLFAIAIPSFCSADVTKLSAEDRKALEDLSRFHEVHSTGDLPAAILALFGGDNGSIAEPGQKWNATDAITDPTLPAKRSFGQRLAANISSCISSAAESLTRFTFWLPNSRRMKPNPK